MNKSSETDQLRAEIEELSILLENRTFVDYFNTFLCLPVFGQHVFYNFLDREFDFEPPLKNRRHFYIDRRELLKWLCTERLSAFKTCTLYTEYRLCMLLREVKVVLPDVEDEERCRNFTRNVIGNATGMIIFRESMRDTSGESVFRCWKDIESWRLLKDPVKKVYWRHVINTHYIRQNSSSAVPGKTHAKALNGLLNFDLVPDDDVYGLILDTWCDNLPHQFMASDDGLLSLQKVLYLAISKYWLPRHLLHFLKTISKETFEILSKPAPGDVEFLAYERKVRCHLMFRTIDQESSILSPATSVFESQSAEDLPGNDRETPSPSLIAIEDDVSDGFAESNIDPTDLLSLCGGPARSIRLTRASLMSPPYSSSTSDSQDDLSKGKPRSANGGTELRTPVPIVLTSYLGGKKRTLLGQFPKTSNRIIWSLASDALACFPLRQYLKKCGKRINMKYLSFWTDVRSYLDTDEDVIDGYGQPLRRLFAHKIASNYLTSNGDGCEIFSEAMKMSLFTAITTGNDVSLLCMAQDIIQKSLSEPLQQYIQDDRSSFLKQVRGLRYNLTKRQRQAVRATERASRSKSAEDIAAVDPVYFFNCVTMETTGSGTPPSPGTLPESRPCLSSCSRTDTPFHVCITEEQMWKAMEIAVLCSEYGVSMMSPQYLPRAEQVVDVLHSDYGSLHVDRSPAVRHEWLKSLTHKPKICIETIKVSRHVIMDRIDIAYIRSMDSEKDKENNTKGKYKMVRRHGLTIDRPLKPKSLMEVLSTPVQFDFFKRFMMASKMNLPIMFWRAVEDLKELSNSKTRQIRVTQIVRKFFGKFARYGAALDCNEEIIRQIPNMEKVTPGILICAQAAVFRSLERKWFPQYLETFPSDSGNSTPSSFGGYSSTPSRSPDKGILKAFDETAEFVHRARKSKKRTLGSRKTLTLWKTLCKSLVNFCKGMSDKTESQLIEMFLKFEVEREKQSPVKDPMASQMEQQMNKTMGMSTVAANVAQSVQTRVVIRNRLVIINRLPADMKFWTEIKKYQELCDSAAQKGSVSLLDTEFLSDKARSIIACYLSSDILPKVQINIPNDMALTIINSLASVGPTRGLFHDAVVLLFPILYHYYRKFTDVWMKGDIPDDYFDNIEHILIDRVATTPHRQDTVPNFMQLQPEQFKSTTQSSLDDNTMKIHFSLSEGATLIYPQAKVYGQKSGTGAGGRRMTKPSIHALHEDDFPRVDSTLDHGDKKDHKRANKDKEKHKPERKKSEKIIVKESELETSNSQEQAKRYSTDKARRLSILVETLNKEKEEKIKQQNKMFSKQMAFDEVVKAALMADMSDTNSAFSGH